MIVPPPDTLVPPDPGPWVVVNNNWEASTIYGAGGIVVAEGPIPADVTEEGLNR